jgi:sugar-specific transcriptional regulator TrmB
VAKKQLGRLAVQTLARSDLKPGEKVIYLALVNEPVLHVEDIRQRTSLPRSSVYALLKQLMKKDLVIVEAGFVARL